MEYKRKNRTEIAALAPRTPALSEDDLIKGPIDERYEQAVVHDRANVFAGVRAPSLFNWFVGMNCLVAGLVLILFSRLIEDFQIGRFRDWFMPLQAAFILGGLGLVLSEMVEKGSQIWRVVFRLVVAGASFVLAVIWWQGGEFDGVFISLWLALVILVNVVVDLSSLRSYLVFYQGLFVGLTIIFVFFPEFSGLADVLTPLGEASTMTGFVLLVIVALYLILTWRSYFTNKRRLSWLIGLACVPLTLLAFVYANASEWVRSFLILVTALFAFLLPFWDELRFRRGSHRDWVVRMFGVVMTLFVVTVVLIRVLQNILISNTYLFLSDKVTYGRIYADTTINNALAAVKSLAENDIFKRALIRKQSDDLFALSRGFFESNRSVVRIIAVDKEGRIVSAYPLSEGLIGTTINGSADYFARVMTTGLPDVSDVLEPGTTAAVDQRTVALSVPIVENNAPVGALIGYLNLTALADGLAEIATLAASEAFVVIDRAGNWVVSQGRTGVGDPLSNTVVRKGLVRQGYSRDGVLTLAADQQLAPTQWRLVLTQPLFAALSVNQTAYIVVLALTSLLALIVGLTVLIERQVSSDKNE